MCRTYLTYSTSPYLTLTNFDISESDSDHIMKNYHLSEGPPHFFKARPSFLRSRGSNWNWGFIKWNWGLIKVWNMIFISKIIRAKYGNYSGYMKNVKWSTYSSNDFTNILKLRLYEIECLTCSWHQINEFSNSPIHEFKNK